MNCKTAQLKYDNMEPPEYWDDDEDDDEDDDDDEDAAFHLDFEDDERNIIKIPFFKGTYMITKTNKKGFKMDYETSSRIMLSLTDKLDYQINNVYKADVIKYVNDYGYLIYEIKLRTIYSKFSYYKIKKLAEKFLDVEKIHYRLIIKFFN